MSNRTFRLARAAAILLLPLAACQDDSFVTDPHASLVTAQSPTANPNAITVLTRNVYLGAKIEAVASAPADYVPFAAAEAWAKVRATDFTTRAQALADEIAALQPQLVGLQEVTTWRSQTPSDFVLGNFTPNATTVEYDFLALLIAALAQRGLHYNVAAQSQTADFEIPIYTGAGPIPFTDIRYNDSEVILVRSDVDVLSSYAQTFDAARVYDLGGISIAEQRGWTAASVQIGKRALTFVNTHLLGQDTPDLQTQETTQLLQWIGSQSAPVLLVGDFNSAANANASSDRKTDTYGMLLSAGFTDLWNRGTRPNDGLTCCHEELLLNTTTNFDQRLDLILLNQGMDRLVGSAQMTVIGTDPLVRQRYGLWPSDHAGVFALIHMPM